MTWETKIIFNPVDFLWCRGYLGPGFMGKKGYFYSIFLVLFKVILTRENRGNRGFRIELGRRIDEIDHRFLR